MFRVEHLRRNYHLFPRLVQWLVNIANRLRTSRKYASGEPIFFLAGRSRALRIYFYKVAVAHWRPSGSKALRQALRSESLHNRLNRFKVMSIECIYNVVIIVFHFPFPFRLFTFQCLHKAFLLSYICSDKSFLCKASE